MSPELAARTLSESSAAATGTAAIPRGGSCSTPPAIVIAAVVRPAASVRDLAACCRLARLHRRPTQLPGLGPTLRQRNRRKTSFLTSNFSKIFLYLPIDFEP